MANTIQVGTYAAGIRANGIAFDGAHIGVTNNVFDTVTKL
jgi:hypothetical protein